MWGEPPDRIAFRIDEALTKQGQRYAAAGAQNERPEGLIPHSSKLSPENVRALRDPFLIYQLDAVAYPLQSQGEG